MARLEEAEHGAGPDAREWLDRAEAHLMAGWDYTNRIPFTWLSLRLACAWPILIGLETIARLRSGNVLDSAQRIKISRREVKKIILRSVLRYPFPRLWRNLAANPSRRPSAATHHPS